jgi:lipid-binding SYLF domain-containing protein
MPFVSTLAPHDSRSRHPVCVNPPREEQETRRIADAAAGKLGLQIGDETIDLVLLIMNDHGVDRLLEDEVALGGEASVAAGPLGRDARVMTDV